VRRALLVVAALLGGVLAPLAPTTPGRAAERCVEAGEAIPGVPWAQQRLEPRSIWPVSTGAGVRVAVLASGVDARHTQLRGRVSGGEDVLSGGSSSPTTDCQGIGTSVAGTVAAAFIPNVGFHGLAPKATIVPYRVATGTVVVPPENEGDTENGSPQTVADGIRAATAARSDVLVVPVVTYVDDPELKSAVAAAVAADIVVIAAVGEGPGTEEGPAVPYPAAYDGVIGVAPFDAEGTVAVDAGALKAVDLVAPGAGLLSTQAGGGLVEAGGSPIAAGYVAGAAALVRSRWPQAKASDVVQRLLATAAPMPGEAGYGAVSPAQAVTEIMATGEPSVVPSDLATVPPDAAARAARDRSTAIEAVVAVAVLVVALLGVGFAVALPLGRRRRWRPGVAPRPEEHPEDEVPAPPRTLFEDRR